MTLSVIDVLSPTVTPVYFLTVGIETKNQQKSDKVCFGEAMNSSLSF